jgi:hypothetical protein
MRGDDAHRAGRCLDERGIFPSVLETLRARFPDRDHAPSGWRSEDCRALDAS